MDSKTRWPTGAVAGYALTLLVGGWLLINTQDDDPAGPLLVARILRALLVVAMIGALQHRWRGLRVLGFMGLWWIPCWFFTLYVVVAVIGAPVGGETGSGTTKFVEMLGAIALVEAAAIAGWVNPRLFRSSFSGQPPADTPKPNEQDRS